MATTTGNSNNPRLGVAMVIRSAPIAVRLGIGNSSVQSAAAKGRTSRLIAVISICEYLDLFHANILGEIVLCRVVAFKTQTILSLSQPPEKHFLRNDIIRLQASFAASLRYRPGMVSLSQPCGASRYMRM